MSEADDDLEASRQIAAGFLAATGRKLLVADWFAELLPPGLRELVDVYDPIEVEDDG